MYTCVSTAIVCGIDSLLVSAEADISSGMPMFDIVGYLSSEVREAKERVRTAIKNCGYSMPVKHITVNISPAGIRKRGTGFDLAIAVSVLSASEVIKKKDLKDVVMIGELGLDGSIHPVPGVLSMVLAAAEHKRKLCIVPKENAAEASLVPSIQIVGVGRLDEVVSYLNGEDGPKEVAASPEEKEEEPVVYDFANVNGQRLLRRACEIAAAGMHNLMMIGPPGSGKSMAAKCIPSILPPMTKEERLTLSKIYSVCGLLTEGTSLLSRRPYRSPHHTISNAGLIGGGSPPHPGEISLAHGGVLFLDELTEFRRDTLEALRAPMEDRQVSVAREGGNFTFPSDFVLVAAMNPCKCGYYPDLSRCRCSQAQIERYLGKLSQPMLDRIDICVEAPRLSFTDITGQGKNECSADILQRVRSAHRLQRERYKKEVFDKNSRIPADKIPVYCALGKKETKFMERMYAKLSLTGRTYHKLLRVARTVADLEGKERIALSHLKEVICYRSIDRSEWEGGL